jgi:hypothetical protein
MKRIIKVLVVSALMATTVSPAFAKSCDDNHGWGCRESLQDQGGTGS